MRWFEFLLLTTSLGAVVARTTMRKTNPFFSMKRYLDFPEGSTFIATGSFIKFLLFTQQGGYYAVLGEIDVPFSLPSYSPSKDRKSRFLARHRRELRDNTLKLITKLGLDGNCLDSIFCEMNQYQFPDSMQFTKHLLKTTATYFEEHGLRNAGGGEDCEDSLRKCGVFLLPELIKVFAEGDSSFNEV